MYNVSELRLRGFCFAGYNSRHFLGIFKEKLGKSFVGCKVSILSIFLYKRCNVRQVVRLS